MSTTERVLLLSETGGLALAAVRSQPGLRVAREAAGAESRLWVRGLPPTGQLALAVRQLPTISTFGLDAEGRLFPVASLTPTTQLPSELEWQPIQEFLRLELPTAALPGQLPAPHPLRLVPASRAMEGAALLTTLAAWQTYASSAPEIRLQRLRFAVAGPERVLVLGTPLPSVPGQEHWLHHNVLLPAGLEFESPLLALLVAQKYNPHGNALLLFAADGSLERIPHAYLVPATRSAARLTTGSSEHDKHV
ncbi:hypothetical protein K3G63_09665 [Hymenobacter sp. HSC-4F20]|uniref:hypothetical protein n=1 Tax=Hymenobacter sp. HSC-4F20 TaxID=2864135 RepID=UPI001C72C3CB|nr:hypothetical protein [Hymenobacter sp. HSC-4F20]MBX0290705.1 hypothetical protein [Hymenobacter sp. HSC-4F20]